MVILDDHVELLGVLLIGDIILTQQALYPF